MLVESSVFFQGWSYKKSGDEWKAEQESLGSIYFYKMHGYFVLKNVKLSTVVPSLKMPFFPPVIAHLH